MYDWLSLQVSSNYQWEKCLALGSILRCPFPVTVGAARHVLYCCHRGQQDGVFIILHEFIPLHHVIFLNALTCSYELNTLDAWWIPVDVWSNSSRWRIVRSTWHRRDAYMHNHCLGYHHNFALFYQLLDSNFFTHRNTYATWEKPLVKPMAPGSILYHISLLFTFIRIFTFPIYIIKYQKYIAAIYLLLFSFTF